MLNSTDFDANTIIEELTRDDLGITSIKRLLHTPQQLATYAKQRFGSIPKPKLQTLGVNQVKQQLSSISQFEPNDPITQLRNELNEFIRHKFGNLFDTEFDLNVQEINRYSVGDAGISPHLDPIKSINLVVVVVLEGQGSLCRCKNRQGENSIEIDTKEGNVILMRANGFKPNSDRPFHYITNIVRDRYTIVFRQYPLNERPSWIN